MTDTVTEEYRLTDMRGQTGREADTDGEKKKIVGFRHSSLGDCFVTTFGGEKRTDQQTDRQTDRRTDQRRQRSPVLFRHLSFCDCFATTFGGQKQKPNIGSPPHGAH